LVLLDSDVVAIFLNDEVANEVFQLVIKLMKLPRSENWILGLNRTGCRAIAKIVNNEDPGRRDTRTGFMP